MKRLTLMAIAIALFPLLQLHAQYRGYVILGDTLLTGGKIKFDPSRPAEVEFLSGSGKRTTYTADQLSEFGFKEDGTAFKPFSILYNGRQGRVFLEQVEAGELELYLLSGSSDKYFLKTDSLQLLEREHYLNLIRQLNEACPGRERQYKLVRYKRASLANFVRDHNLKKCRNLPFFHVGASLAYSGRKLLIPDRIIPSTTFRKYRLPTSNLSFAVFADQPLWSLPGFSLTTEIGFSKTVFTEALFSRSENQDIKVEMTNIDLALTPHYTFNAGNFRPYLSAGALMSTTTQSDARLLVARLEGSVVSLESYDQFIRLPDILYGFIYGAGMQVFYTHRHFIALEFSGRRLSGSQSINLTGFDLKLKANL